MRCIVLDFWDVFVFLGGRVFSGCFFIIFSMEPSPKSREILFFCCFFCIFHVFFLISLNLLTCILKKKRAFYLDFEAMWCKIYCYSVFYTLYLENSIPVSTRSV